VIGGDRPCTSAERSKTSATLDMFYGCREVRRTCISSDSTTQQVCHGLGRHADGRPASLSSVEELEKKIINSAHGVRASGFKVLV